MQARSISSRLELVSLAAAQVREGKTALAEFIANRGSKAVDEAIQLAKEFAEAETRLNRSKKTRIELLEEELTGECIETVVKGDGLELRKSYSSATRSKSVHFAMQFTVHWKKVEGSIAMFIYMVLQIAGNRLLYRH